ncbi:MAG TPA: anion transporter, partial [Acidobacteriota bacterium]|nr:anion transporter [Acidobacteriota bacterium]
MSTQPESPLKRDTIQMTVTELESQFESLRQRSGLVLGPLVFFSLWFLPMSRLSPEAHRLAAILGLVVVLWITEA